MSRASAERYRRALEGLESARRALQDERQSLEIDFRAVLAQIESICLSACQIEIGQARLDTLVKEQVLNSREFLETVRTHVGALDRTIAIAYGSDADEKVLTTLAMRTQGALYKATATNIRSVYLKAAQY